MEEWGQRTKPFDSICSGGKVEIKAREQAGGRKTNRGIFHVYCTFGFCFHSGISDRWEGDVDANEDASDRFPDPDDWVYYSWTSSGGKLSSDTHQQCCLNWVILS